MYLSKKMSMAQIASKLKLSVSTIRYHLDKSGTPRRSRSEAINYWYAIKQNKKPFQLKTIITDTDANLKTAGIMLYWGEGAKTMNVVKFTNSDPAMIRLFLDFLRVICGVDESRLKALIHIYPDHNEAKLIKFWTRTTGIPLCNFYKSFLQEGKKGTYRNKSKYGTITINYPDTKLLKAILTWIDEYRKKYSYDITIII